MNPSVKRPTDAKKDGLVVIMKGAPERIITRCTHVLINGEERPLDEENHALVQYANDSFGK